MGSLRIPCARRCSRNSFVVHMLYCRLGPPTGVQDHSAGRDYIPLHETLQFVVDRLATRGRHLPNPLSSPPSFHPPASLPIRTTYHAISDLLNHVPSTMAPRLTGALDSESVLRLGSSCMRASIVSTVLLISILHASTLASLSVQCSM